MKVRAQKSMCLDCGEDFINDIGYCVHCRKRASAGDLNPYPEPDFRPYEDLDMPIRASNLMFADGLLFTESWYLPVLLVVYIVTAMFFFSPDVDINRVLVLIASIMITVVVALTAWKIR